MLFLFSTDIVFSLSIGFCTFSGLISTACTELVKSKTKNQKKKIKRKNKILKKYKKHSRNKKTINK
jgi:hypothetical protein